MSPDCPSTVMYGYFAWKLSRTFCVVAARVGLPHQEKVSVTGSVLNGSGLLVPVALVPEHAVMSAPTATLTRTNVSPRGLKRFTRYRLKRFIRCPFLAPPGSGVVG